MTEPAVIADRLAESFDNGSRRLMEPDWRSFGRDYLPSSPYMQQGRLTWWEPGTKTTWLDPEVAPFTTGDVARRWLRSELGDRNATAFSSMYDLLDLPQPLYYIGGKVLDEDCAYVDIVRAYHALYAGHTYDMAVAIKPTRVAVVEGLMPLDMSRTHFFVEDSEARNSIVGMARMRWLMISRYGRYQRLNGISRITSAGLWAYIALCLNAIAQEAIEWFEAFYVGTDGYIIPGEQAPAFRAFLAERWNVDSRIEGRGRTTVTRLGRYSVGRYRSARLGTGEGDPADNLYRLDRSQRDSLTRTRFAHA